MVRSGSILPDARRLDGVLRCKAAITYFPETRLMQQLLRLHSGAEEERHQEGFRVDWRRNVFIAMWSCSTNINKLQNVFLYR